MRKVVITGLGIVSCIGNNKEEVLESLINTKSGIVFSEEQKKYNFRSQVSGNIKNLNLDEHIDRKQKRYIGEGSAYNFIVVLISLLRYFTMSISFLGYTINISRPVNLHQ